MTDREAMATPPPGSPSRAPVESAPPRLTGWLDHWLTRWAIVGPFRRDMLLSLLVATIPVLFIAFLSLLPPQPELEHVITRPGWIVAVAVAQSLALCLRRIRPYWCLAAVILCQLAIIGFAPEAALRFLAPLIAVYTIGSLAPTRIVLLATGSAVLAEGAASIVVVARQPVDPIAVMMNYPGAGLIVYGLAAFVGSYVASRRQVLRIEREQAAEAIRAQRARLRSAIATERTQIARELHDVAAHHLSSMVVQAAAVERLVDRDPGAAKAGAMWLRRQGKETLENLRQVVGLLRNDDQPGDGTALVPGMQALENLVRIARDLGDEVSVERAGEPLPLPPIADISLYRIAQQALTNARQHAPGAPVRVRLEYSDRDVALDIVNGAPSRDAEPGRAAGGGTGLVGMQERADLVGAQLSVGPTDAAGWRVHVRLPVQRAEPAGRGGAAPEEEPLRDQGVAG